MIIKNYRFNNIEYGYIYNQNNRIDEIKKYLEVKYPKSQWCHVNQQHSTHIVPADANNSPPADGLVTSSINQGLLIYTADCLPVMLTDNNILCLVHAGWVGLKDQILKKANSYFTKHPLLVWIGPHNQCYTRSTNDRTVPASFKSSILHNKDQVLLNLRRIAQDQLAPESIVYASEPCTFKTNALPSYRRGDRKNRLYSYAVKVTI